MSKSKIVLIAPNNFIGQRLDKALSQIPEIQTRSRAEMLIDSGNVFINGKTPKSSYRVKEHDSIEIQLPEITKSEILPLDMKLDIVFEDQDIIVLNKPAGLVVHPAVGHAQDTLVNALLFHTQNLSMKFGEQRPGIVHRLDRDTTGLLVIAKNDFAHEQLSHLFRTRKIHRLYFALCIGKVKSKSGKIQSYLARHPQDRKRYASVLDSQNKIITKMVDPSSGKWSITNYEILKENAHGLSYVQLKLETGRTHQIRVHLSEHGIPIAGDLLYGAAKKLKTLKSQQVQNLVKQLPHFALHAAQLGFQHPRNQKELFFEVDWPSDMKVIIQQLGIL